MKNIAKSSAENHECIRFKTAVKRFGIRCVVACRSCGKRKVIAYPHGNVVGPSGKLP